jgi:MFS family permease
MVPRRCSISAESPKTPSFDHARARRAGLAAFVGTAIEWYDFYVYGTAAALVFGPLFFPGTDRLAGIIASFATYAVGFFARPIGGIIFGHIGDRLGRRPSLVITLLLMGVSTVLVGLLPTYQEIGAWAPMLLIALRVLQGLAVGGEWGGAVLMAVEHAPEGSKTFYGGFPQLGNPAGALLASGVFWALSLQGEGYLVGGGWRIPFIVSIVLICVGFWVRFRVEETPVFEQRVEGHPQSLPLAFALSTNWIPILLGIGLLPISVGGYYIASTFTTSYGTGPEIGVSVPDMLRAMSIAAFAELLVTLPIAWLGDRWGRKRVMLTGLVGSALLVMPLFLTMSGNAVPLFILLLSLVRVLMTATYAPVATIIAQMFRPQARYTSISITYGVAVALWAGLSPLTATWLYAETGTIWSVILMVFALALLSIACTVLAPQLRDEDAGSS